MSEILVIYSALTHVIVQKDFIACSHCRSVKSCIVTDDGLIVRGREIMVLRRVQYILCL
jgi:hypothetical protein